MTTLREAAQQALEALDSCDAAHPSDGGRQWYDDKLVEPAINALRAALADGDNVAPTEQPQRKPLTDDQLLEILGDIDADTKRLPPGLKAFARAIERAHGITGESK